MESNHQLLERGRRARTIWVLLALALGLIAGCGLRPSQRQQIHVWEKEAAELGHPEVRYEEHLDPTTAAALGFVFGAGGFYVHRPGLGVTGLIFWPLSVTWVAPAAYSSAQQYNFREFRDTIQVLRDAEAHRVHAAETAASTRRVEESGIQGRMIEPPDENTRLQVRTKN